MLSYPTESTEIVTVQVVTDIHETIVRSSDTELCSNWWPTPHLPVLERMPGMPHPLCRLCANWLPDIEDIGKGIRISPSAKRSGCGNDWPAAKNHAPT